MPIKSPKHSGQIPENPDRTNGLKRQISSTRLSTGLLFLLLLLLANSAGAAEATDEKDETFLADSDSRYKGEVFFVPDHFPIKGKAIKAEPETNQPDDAGKKVDDQAKPPAQEDKGKTTDIKPAPKEGGAPDYTAEIKAFKAYDDLLENPARYQTLPYFAELLKNASKTDQMKVLDLYIKNKAGATGEAAVKGLAMAYPAQIFDGSLLDDSDDSPKPSYHDELIKLAVFSAAEEHPGDFLNYYHDIHSRNLPYFMEALVILCKKYPREASFLYTDASSKPEENPVLNVALRETPRDVLTYFSNKPDSPTLRYALKSAAKDHPEIFFRILWIFQCDDAVKEALLVAGEFNPEITMKNYLEILKTYNSHLKMERQFVKG